MNQKNTLFKIIVLYFFILNILFSCTSENDNDTGFCIESEMVLTPRQIKNPSSGAIFFIDTTYDSIKANSNSIVVYRRDKISEVRNFKLREGYQELKESTYGKITQQFLGEDLVFTTYYVRNQPDPNTPIIPEGEIIIESINNDCNTISGSVYIRAVGYHFDSVSGTGLLEVWNGITFKFENLPLDNKFHQL